LSFDSRWLVVSSDANVFVQALESYKKGVLLLT
jgi:hypothetical protein